LTILIISYIRALKRAPAAVIFAAPFQGPNAQCEKPVDLDFYTGREEMQAPASNQ
jgi:hypothetical protein